MPKSLGLAIAKAKCPHCREGNLFPVSPFSYFRLSETCKHCEVCGSNLIHEPGFYDGAMYISYAFSVALVITPHLFQYRYLLKPQNSGCTCLLW